MVVIEIKYVIYFIMSKEVIITDKIVVSCNGDDRQGSNHPKVWLKIKETESSLTALTVSEDFHINHQRFRL